MMQGDKRDLGKGEVGGSIPLGSTSQPLDTQGVLRSSTPLHPETRNGTKRDFPEQSGGNPGTPFYECSPLILTAAHWLADHKAAPDDPIAVLGQKFAISPRDAGEAVILARRFRICRRAFG